MRSRQARWLAPILLLWLAACTPVRPTSLQQSSVDTIAFGSCANQAQPQPIWDAVIANAPDLFIFLGDNVYGDTEDETELRAKYALLGGQPGFQRLRSVTPVVATWDDHDYGANDVGAEFPAKEMSKQAFLDFFGEPADSERRTRDGGVYTSYEYGGEGERVQVLLLDTRWSRSPLARLSDERYAQVKQQKIGPYAPNTDPGATLLGAEQWVWLEQELRKPADLRVIATSIPFVQDGTGWELWANFPADRARLLALIDELELSGVLFITGDTHRAQFSTLKSGAPYPLWEVNSSGLTENVHPDNVAPDRNRAGEVFVGDNFGLIRIDWGAADPTITLEIRDVDNTAVLSHELRLSELRAPP